MDGRTNDGIAELRQHERGPMVLQPQTLHRWSQNDVVVRNLALTFMWGPPAQSTERCIALRHRCVQLNG